MGEVLEGVRKIIVERVGVDEGEVKMEGWFKEDLGGDWVDVVEVVMEVEDELDMEICEEDGEKIGRVGEGVK